jgi:hypothetical protein
VLFFVLLPAATLCVPHSPAAPLLGHRKVVAEATGGTDQVIQLEGPILATGERPEAIEDEVFRRGLASGSVPELFVEQETMSPKMLGEALDGGVGDAVRTRHLAMPGARDLAEKHGR